MSRIASVAGRMAVPGMLAAAPSIGAASISFDWVASQVFNKIQATGTRVLGLHLYQVSGDKSAQQYSNLSGYGNQTFTDFGSISLIGRQVLGLFNFNAQINDNRYSDPNTQAFSLNYHKGHYLVNAGTIQGTLLNTNMFTSFNRFLNGVQTGYTSGKASFMGIVSQARGTSQTVSFQGNNSSGPYYLNSSRIVPDSVQVRVDNQPQALGTDYTVDQWTGTLQFFRAISPASSIVVSYEALGDAGAGGSIMGAGFAYDMGKAGKLGLSTLMQRTGGSSTPGSYTDKFAGRPAIFAYTLSYTPLPGTVIAVHVDSVTLVQGIDFFVNPNNPREVTLSRDVLDTQTVFVTYRIPPTANVDGDTHVVGADYSIPLGKKGQGGQLAFSEAFGGPLSGALKSTAKGAEFDYDYKGIKTQLSWRDVPDTFAGVETDGFNRNERAYDAAMTYKRKQWSYTLATSNSLIGTQSTDANGLTTYLHGRYVQQHAGINFAQSQDSSWSLAEDRTATHAGAAPDTQTESTTLTHSQVGGRLTQTYSLQRESAVAPLNGLVGSAVTPISFNTASLGYDYALASGWSLGAHGSLSAIKASGQDSSGRDVRLVANYVGNKKLTVSTTYSFSNSGLLSSLGGFQNGAGLGYGGNGFSGSGLAGPYSATNFNEGTSEIRLWTTHAEYLLSHRMSVRADYTTSMAAGTVNTNSSGNSMNLDLNWDLGRQYNVWTGINKTTDSFIGTAGATKSTSFDLRFTASPKGNWSYDMWLSELLATGSSVAQNSYRLDTTLAYRLNRNSQFGASLSTGRTLNFEPQQDNQFSVFYRRKLFGSINLLTTYRFRNVANLDGTLPGAYRLHGLDVELELGFNSGR